MVTITIGRDPGNKIIIHDPTKRVSGKHAEIKVSENNTLFLVDISMNGTYVNGKRVVPNQQVSVKRGDNIVFANAARLDWNQVPVLSVTPNIVHTITVGKSTDNRINIHHDKMSKYHSTIKVDKRNKVYIFDQSLNGTYVNGNLIPKYTDVEVKRGNSVSFANVANLNWSQVPKVGIGLAKIIIPLIVIALIGVGFTFRAQILDAFSFNKSISEKYKNSVGLIVNEFYYVHLNAKGDTVYVIGQNGIANYSSNYSNIKPFAITGTGFAISEDGKIITNRHVATPWENDEFKKEVTAFIQKKQIEFRDYDNMLASTTSGFSVRVGIIPNDTEIDMHNYENKLVPLKLLDVEQKKEIDLALMQVVSKQLPPSFTYVSTDNFIKEQSEISVDDEITIIGFPVGFNLAMKNKDSKVKSTSTHGRISKINDKYEIQFDAASIGGASGAPIFNKNGVLIAVNYAGYAATQGYNFGIIATHINNLMR